MSLLSSKISAILLLVLATIGACFQGGSQRSDLSKTARTTQQDPDQVPNQQKPDPPRTAVQVEEPERADDTRLYMRVKLASSQMVLDGLVSENFQLITEGALRMKEISEAAHWPTAEDKVYQHYSIGFRQQCEKLIEQASRKDLQAAHYTFLHLSTTCIDCHSYVRPRFEVKRSRRGQPVQLIPTYWDSKKPSSRSTTPTPDIQDKNG